MKIEFLMDYKHEGTHYEAGDRQTFPDEVGAFFCRAGVAKDLNGAVATEPVDKNKTVRLEVEKLDIKNSVTEG